jgi:hypothetical protein
MVAIDIGRQHSFIQTGDFCCLPMSGDGGKLIRLGEVLNGNAFSQYQHAAIYIRERPGVFGDAPFGWLFAAMPRGASFTRLNGPPEDLLGALWSTGVIQLAPDQRSDILVQCNQLQDTPYSWLDYEALLLHRLGIPAPGLKKFIGDSGHCICSQLCDLVYSRAGIHLFTDGRWPGYVTPADLAGVIEKAIHK